MVCTRWVWRVTTDLRSPLETGRGRMLVSKCWHPQVLRDAILAFLRPAITVMALAPHCLKHLWLPELSFAILRGRPVCQTMPPHFRITSRCFIEIQVVVW